MKKNKILRFKDGKISIGGQDLFASSASFSISTSLEVERVYGEFDSKIVGAKTQFVDFTPTQMLKGQLDVSFFISADQFVDNTNINKINRLFDIGAGMSEAPINNNIVGRYRFDNMYLKSFSFDMAPFQVIKANASYDIYGSIDRVYESRFDQSSANFAHSLKSFGSLLVGNSYTYDYEGYVLSDPDLAGFYNNPVELWDYNQDGVLDPIQSRSITEFGESHWLSDGISEGRSEPKKISSYDEFEIANLKYNILVNRKVHNHIRSNENTIVNTNARGVVPVRVSVESIEKEITIEANEIIEKLNAYGDQQNSSTPFGIEPPRLEAFLMSSEGQKIANFSVSGKIQNQSMSIAEGQLARGSISLKEVIK